MADLEARFWSYVGPPDEGGCRLWRGAKNSSGYGTFTVGAAGGSTTTRQQGAHVVAWRIAHGWRQVGRGRVVRHRCDVKLCVEPTHLVSGTTSQNLRECYQRGRRKPPRAHDLLTIDMIEAGRRLVEERRLNQRELAELWGVRPTVVSRALRGVTYGGLSTSPI